jgi:hypothetical protein
MNQAHLYTKINALPNDIKSEVMDFIELIHYAIRTIQPSAKNRITVFLRRGSVHQFPGF